MIRTTVGLLSLLVASVWLGPLSAQTIKKPAVVEVDGTIEWVYNYAEGQLLSQASGKPMFVVFRCER